MASSGSVNRNALERVLARAAELQGAAGDQPNPSDNLTEQQIMELAQEVGLSAEHIRQALAEERVRVEPLVETGSGLAFRVFGPDHVGAQRVVRGAPDRVLDGLDRWMQREESLGVVRQRADRIVWEPRRGIVSVLRRAFGGKEHALDRASSVAATVVAVDKEFTLVRVEADFAVLRRTMGSQTIAGTVFGSGTAAALLLMGVMAPVAIAPAVIVSGAAFGAARRTQRHAIARALLAIEHALDRLERGEGQQHRLIKMIESALPPTR